MRIFSILSALFAASLTLFGTHAIAQAHVVENQTFYNYVNGATGADTNAGTRVAPFKTIQAGVNQANTLNQKGIGVRVEIQPGIYHEWVNIYAYRSTELPSNTERLKEAHLVLRIHGKTLCKDKAPLCGECPVSVDCKYAQSPAVSLNRPAP